MADGVKVPGHAMGCVWITCWSPQRRRSGAGVREVFPSRLLLSVVLL